MRHMTPAQNHDPPVGLGVRYRPKRDATEYRACPRKGGAAEPDGPHRWFG